MRKVFSKGVLLMLVLMILGWTFAIYADDAVATGPIEDPMQQVGNGHGHAYGHEIGVGNPHQPVPAPGDGTTPTVPTLGPIEDPME